jgi:hypothetical protein
MSNILQAAAGVGFLLSPFGDLPMGLMMIMVDNPSACRSWIQNPTSVSESNNVSAVFPGLAPINPCAPVDPAAMNGVFIAVGLLLLVWWAYPFLKDKFTSR